MSEKWTPGPWRETLDTVASEICTIHCVTPRSVKDHPEAQGWLYIISEASRRQGRDAREQDANARLIAAATDMAEALIAQDEAVDEHSKCDCHRHPEDFVCSMCTPCVSRYLRASELRAAALRKARGEP